MKKETPMASPTLTEEVLQSPDLVREYVEFLRLGVKRNRDGEFHCETSDEAYRCWEQTEQFCKEKGLDSDSFVHDFALIFGCESNVANSFDLEAFGKKIKEPRKEG